MLNLDSSLISQRRFGFELEAYNVPAHRVKDYLHQVYGLGRYQVKSDGSIGSVNVNEPISYPFEMVSPIHRGKLGLERVHQAVTVVNQLGAKVNSTCGLHVHIDTSDLELVHIKRVFKRFIKFEPIFKLLIEDSRHSNSYCRSLLARHGSIKEAFAAIDAASNLTELARVVNGGIGSSDRYFMLNIQSYWRHGTLEFRLKEATVDPDEIVNWINLLLLWFDDSIQISTRVGKENPKLSSLIEMMAAPKKHTQLSEPHRYAAFKYMKAKAAAAQ